MDKQTRRLWILAALFAAMVVTAAGGYLVREWKIVQHRKALIAAEKATGPPYLTIMTINVDWRWSFLIRHWMGDREVVDIFFKDNATVDQIENYQDAFPEAELIRQNKEVPERLIRTPPFSRRAP